MRVTLATLTLTLALSTMARADDDGDAWVDGPEAPLPTAPIGPATAPRDGEPGRGPPTEPLAVPPRPPEDARVDAIDGLPVPAAPLRLQSSVDRRALTSTAGLDLDNALTPLAAPGLVWLARSAGAQAPVARGQRPGEVGIVVDGVPVLVGAGLAAFVEPTELLSAVGAARLTYRHGPRAFSPAPTSTAGVIDVDTGGPLTELGETMRTDGLIAAGVGGADVEKGAHGVVRTGWRRLRVIGHGAVLHRDDLRPGRAEVGVPAQPTSTEVLRHTGGAGGTVGARVDVAPAERTRVFVSYLAGRSLDVSDPLTCPPSDALGRSLDCQRTAERGADVAIVGADVATDVAGLTVAPGARLHLQRALRTDERAGRALPSVDTNVDEVVRGGATLQATLLSRTPVAFDLRPRLDLGLDLYADRVSSSFASRSTVIRDAAPPGAGIPDPARARAKDGAAARTGVARARVSVASDAVSVEVGARLVALQLTAPANPAIANDVGVDALLFSPSVDTALALRVAEATQVFVAAGVVAGGAEPAALAAAADVDAVRGAERFVELGVTSVGEAIEVGAVGFGALRATDAATDALDGVVGVEGSVTLKPAPDGLRLRAALAGVVVDAATFTDAQAPAAGVIQPQVSVQASYTPTNQPFGVTLRVWGGLPHNRLALAEVQDASLCPEQAGDPPRGGACSGVPAFAIVDVGAYVRLGQFRLDVSGVNALDVEGRYRGAALPVGGATVRARLSLFF